MKLNRNNNKGLVYSSELGSFCQKCGSPSKRCTCGNASVNHPKDGIVRIGRETKGRRGSGVCIITGIALDEKALKKLAKQLKQKCGTGGTVKSGVIEIQGDHREMLKAELIKHGYAVKLSGS